MWEEDDDFSKYHQTNKFYNEIKNYYRSIGLTTEMPFPVVTVHINNCWHKFNTRHYGYKPKHKIIYLSLKYLDEIKYPLIHI